MGPLFVVLMLGQSPPPLVAAPPAFEPGELVRGTSFPKDFSGQEIFVARCAACHGREGKGNGALQKFGGLGARDVTSAEWQSSRSDEEILAAISLGLAGTRMKGFKNLGTPEQLDALVKLIRALRAPVVAAATSAEPVPAL